MVGVWGFFFVFDGFAFSYLPPSKKYLAGWLSSLPSWMRSSRSGVISSVCENRTNISINFSNFTRTDQHRQFNKEPNFMCCAIGLKFVSVQYANGIVSECFDVRIKTCTICTFKSFVIGFHDPLNSDISNHFVEFRWEFLSRINW